MKTKYAITTIFAAVIGLSACQKPNVVNNTSNSASNVIRIASVSPLSGGSANAGTDNLNGATMAVEEINANGGIEVAGKKYTLELVAEDDAADPKQGTTVAQKIADDKSIVAVVGHYNSGVTMAANPIYARANLVAITPDATNPDVIGKAPKTDSGITSMYRMVAHDGMRGPAMAVFAQGRGYKKMAVFDDATAFGKGAADQVENKSKELGIEIATRESLTDKTTDFKTVLTKAKSSGVDSIMWGGLDDTAATLVKQARELGLTAALFSPDACTDNYMKLAGKAAEGTVCSVSGIPLSEMKAGADFKKRYEKRFAGQTVQAYSPYAYDAVYVVAEAIKKAGVTNDRAKIAAAVANVQIQGLTGDIAFEASGERKNPVVSFVEAQGGTWKTVTK